MLRLLDSQLTRDDVIRLYNTSEEELNIWLEHYELVSEKALDRKATKNRSGCSPANSERALGQVSFRLTQQTLNQLKYAAALAGVSRRTALINAINEFEKRTALVNAINEFEKRLRRQHQQNPAANHRLKGDGSQSKH